MKWKETFTTAGTLGILTPGTYVGGYARISTTTGTAAPAYAYLTGISPSPTIAPDITDPDPPEPEPMSLDEMTERYG